LVRPEVSPGFWAPMAYGSFWARRSQREEEPEFPLGFFFFNVLKSLRLDAKHWDAKGTNGWVLMKRLGAA